MMVGNRRLMVTVILKANRSSVAGSKDLAGRRSFGNARRPRFLPRRKIDHQQFLERLDFGEKALSQTRILFRGERREQLAAPPAEFPNPRAFEQLNPPQCLMALEPEHELGRSARESAILWRRATKLMF